MCEGAWAAEVLGSVHANHSLRGLAGGGLGRLRVRAGQPPVVGRTFRLFATLRFDLERAAQSQRGSVFALWRKCSFRYRWFHRANEAPSERALERVVTELPLSAVVPTIDRSASLARTLESLEQQQLLPSELIVVDASQNSDTREMLIGFAQRIGGNASVRWLAANSAGAAAQRNQGVAESRQPSIWFFDDDVRFEPECLARLWRVFDGDPLLGGVSAMITNQHYQTPGLASRWMFRLMAGGPSRSYAGRVIGPAVNLLPEDHDGLAEVVPVEWLNLTCTIYRRAAMPQPPFPDVFHGYSFMEDLALSLAVGSRWKLANARTARIFHDSQPGAHKSDPGSLAEMVLVNRCYVMTQYLRRTKPRDYLRLLAWTAFMHLAALRSSDGRRSLGARLRGELRGIQKLRRSRARKQ